MVYLPKITILNGIKTNLFFCLSLIFTTSVWGQSYFTNGDARAIGGSCYELTAARNMQLGSVWYADKLDLSKDFDLEFELNFGTNDGGADGIVFVMQTVGIRAIGQSGGGIGFEGFSPSLGIEFDTWQNIDMGDIFADHIAILRNGSVNHTSTNSIAPPIAALPNGGNIEDGVNHLVRITWQAATNRLEVWFDCSKRHSITLDISNAIFGGEREVFWGFTSATGGASNRHVACLRDDILVQDTFTLCKGDTLLLNAKESFDGTYLWTPANFLDDPTSRTPACSSTIPFSYYVEYKDRCNNTFTDSVQIRVDDPFIMNEANDTVLCDGISYSFDLRNEYDSVRWNNGSVNPLISWRDTGLYSLRAWKGVCFENDTFTIQVNSSPTLVISGDSLFCEDEQTEIRVDIQPPSAALIWQDSVVQNPRIFDKTMALSATVRNECGMAVEAYQVREILLPYLYLGEDSAFCEGDTLVLQAPEMASLVYQWSTGQNTSSVKITEPGEYSVLVSEADLCFDYDTITFARIPLPIIGLVEDVLLCKNEEILLSVTNEFGSVFWNNIALGTSFLLKNIEGLITVKSVNECGIDSTNLFVDLIDCYCRIWLPNAITTNNDNLNETLRPTLDCPKLVEYNLTVYNRWGEKLWESQDASQEWDATYKGQKVQSGVYFWIAKWSGIQNGLVERFADKGVFHVID